MRLVYDPVLVSDEPAARAVVAGHQNIFEHPVIIAPKDIVNRMQVQSAASQGKSDGKVQVSKFSANEVQGVVVNPTSVDAWLVYDDAFAPHWTASIDGASQTILNANLAFKALKIPPGRHEFRFKFTYGLWNFVLLPGGIGLFILLLSISALALANASNQPAARSTPAGVFH